MLILGWLYWHIETSWLGLRIELTLSDMVGGKELGGVGRGGWVAREEEKDISKCKQLLKESWVALRTNGESCSSRVFKKGKERNMQNISYWDFMTAILIDHDLCQLSHCNHHSPMIWKKWHLSATQASILVHQERKHAMLGLWSAFYKWETTVWSDLLRHLDFRTFYSALTHPLHGEGNLESCGPSWWLQIGRPGSSLLPTGMAQGFCQLQVLARWLDRGHSQFGQTSEGLVAKGPEPWDRSSWPRFRGNPHQR